MRKIRKADCQRSKREDEKLIETQDEGPSEGFIVF